MGEQGEYTEGEQWFKRPREDRNVFGQQQTEAQPIEQFVAAATEPEATAEQSSSETRPERNVRIAIDGALVYDGPDLDAAIEAAIPKIRATYPSKYTPESIDHQRAQAGLPPLGEQKGTMLDEQAMGPQTLGDYVRGDRERAAKQEDTMADKTDDQVREIHAALLEEYDQLIDFINGDPIDGSPKKGKIVAGIIHRRNEIARTRAIATHGEPTAQQPSSETAADPVGDFLRRKVADQMENALRQRSAEQSGYSEDQTPAEAPEATEDLDSKTLARHLAARYILQGLLDLSLELLRD